MKACSEEKITVSEQRATPVSKLVPLWIMSTTCKQISEVAERVLRLF
jgi:hypothetical protein